MTLTARFTLLVSALVFASPFTVPLVSGAEKPAGGKVEANPEVDAETLRKYDRNRNGKLDPDEAAELKADQSRAKEKKKKG
jgi:hypothetical protein